MGQHMVVFVAQWACMSDSEALLCPCVAAVIGRSVELAVSGATC